MFDIFAKSIVSIEHKAFYGIHQFVSDNFRLGASHSRNDSSPPSPRAAMCDIVFALRRKRRKAASVSDKQFIIIWRSEEKNAGQNKSIQVMMMHSI